MRESRFLSQEELAERAGVSRATIYKAEGGAGVAPKTGRALAEALGISPEELTSPKAQAPLQLELEEQRGADEERRADLRLAREAGERVRKKMEAAGETPGEDEEQREREQYAEALMAMWAEEGEYLEEEIKASPSGFPLRRAHAFSLGHGFARVLYEEIESTRQPLKALQEVKSRLDAQNDRIGSLWQQTMHPGSREALDEFKRFATRRAEISRGEVDEEGTHSASREDESSA